MSRWTTQSSGSTSSSRQYSGATSRMARSESNSALLPGRTSSRPTTATYGPSASLSQSSSSSTSAAALSTTIRSPIEQSLRDPVQVSGVFDNWTEEDDDYLHNPDPKWDKELDKTAWSVRGFANVGCLFILVAIVIALFAGWPIITATRAARQSTNGAYNLGGINQTGQVPLIPGMATLIDPDTPASVMSRTGFDGHEYDLVFSDEFNKEGRTFWEGDDPYWTAVDLHYWGTGDFEWYHPSAVTTRDGNLVITINQENINNLNFKSGMVQSWNKLCFSNSMYIEVNVSFPGTPEVGGFWPGVWTMGNLGRPGYGATNEGTWPYSYDSCDIGTLPNQTYVNQTGPLAALTGGAGGTTLSFHPGQRLSACTCPGEDHPGPDVNVGRAAPEVDIIEAQIDLSIPQGVVSQSLQLAPFDDAYMMNRTSPNTQIYNSGVTEWNGWLGNTLQQAASAVTHIPYTGYRLTGGGFSTWGFEMFADRNDRSAGYITWVGNGQRAWTVRAGAIGANGNTSISERIIPEEPMEIIMNLGMSNNWQNVDFAHLTFPSEFLIDYIRVYQRPGIGEIGCDPSHHPTSKYINDHPEAYENPNNTIWNQTSYSWPKNRLSGC